MENTKSITNQMQSQAPNPMDKPNKGFQDYKKIQKARDERKKQNQMKTKSEED